MYDKRFFKLKLSEKTQTIWSKHLAISVKVHKLLLKFLKGFFFNVGFICHCPCIGPLGQRAYMCVFALIPFVMARFSISYSLPSQASMNFSVLIPPDMSVTFDTVVSLFYSFLDFDCILRFWLFSYHCDALPGLLYHLLYLSPFLKCSYFSGSSCHCIHSSFNLISSIYSSIYSRSNLSWAQAPICHLLLNFSRWTHQRHLNFSFPTLYSWSSPDTSPIPALQTCFSSLFPFSENNTITHPVAQVRYLVNILDSLYLSQLSSNHSPNPTS